MQPTVGRTVHFFDSNEGPYAAIITRVWTDTCVNLTVFGLNDQAAIVKTSVVLGSDNPTGYRWAWPEIKK